MLFNCPSYGQLSFGIQGGAGISIPGPGPKASGDSKSSSGDISLMYGAHFMVCAGESVGIGAAVYQQSYSFTVHSSSTTPTGYNASDIVHQSNYLFVAPTFSVIFDPKDYFQLNLSPTLGFNSGGTENIKRYSETTTGNTSNYDSTNTSKNITQFIVCVVAQLQENIAITHHLRLSFIEGYNYMTTPITQTKVTNTQTITPGFPSLQVALIYRIHKKMTKYFEPSFR